MLTNEPLRYGVWVVVLFGSFFVTAPAPDGTSVTVNSESFLDIVTGKIDKLDSKMDLLLMSENEGKGHRMNPKMENQICALSSRMIEVENEIDGLKSLHALPVISASSAVSSEVPEGVSSLHSKVADLHKSLETEKSRLSQLEKRVDGLQGPVRPLFPESEIELEFQTCDLKKAVSKDIESLLLMVKWNIFLGKPGNASSTYKADLSYQVFNAIDGDTNTYYHSAKESNPWYFVDLETPHFIWEIRLTLREVIRGGGIKIYLANNVTFLESGAPDVSSLQLFNNHERSSVFTTFIYRRSRGICGRYVVIMREISNEYLIINEIQATGLDFN